MTSSPSLRPRSAGSTSMVRNPTQSSAYAATPLASTRPSSVLASAVTSLVVTDNADVEAGQRDAGEGAARGGDAGDLEDGVVFVALRHPAVVAEERVLGRVRQHGGDRPLAQRLVVGDHPLVALLDAGWTHRQHRVGPPCRRRPRPAQQPVTQRLGLQVGPQRQGAALGLGGRDPVPGRRARRDRLPGDDVLQPDGDRFARPLTVGLDHADPVAPGRAGAQHVRHRGAAAGAGLARQHPAYDDPLAHDMGTQGVGTGVGRHAGILG